MAWLADYFSLVIIMMKINNWNVLSFFIFVN